MATPLKLNELSTDLDNICRTVERALAKIPELADLVLQVESLETFDDLPEAGYSQAIRDTCAAYRRSTRAIYINRDTFFDLTPEVQQAVFAHEIAHALAHHASLMEKMAQYRQFGNFGEEFLADRLACEWGFFEGLRSERVISYGPRYVAALEKWQDEPAYLKAMHLWHIQKQAGIV